MQGTTPDDEEPAPENGLWRDGSDLHILAA